jgi:hypothetical protein
MSHSGDGRSAEDDEIESVATAQLRRLGLVPIKASQVSGTGDYLDKIIDLIRGCGFGVAVFSAYTPAPTLGNIFFEVGLCAVFGKPVVILKTHEARIPSDFVRTEWVSRKGGQEEQFRLDVRNAFKSVKESASFFASMGDVAMEADRVDYELAFERYAQAILIGGDQTAVGRVAEIRDALGVGSPGNAMEAARSRLLESVSHFLRLLPA